MAKKKNTRITISGNMPRPGQRQPAIIRLTQPKRFNIDTADFMTAVKAAENVDYTQRAKLYDLYNDILLDAHLSSVIDKRKNAVLSSSIEFHRNGKPDEKINEQLFSPWFYRCVADILDARFWGFSLMQFYKKGEWVDYDLVPRKHVEPVRKLILTRQTDILGTSWEEFEDLLFIGGSTDLGLLARAAPWVIYKRNTTADWAQFSEVFGMPIQEYTYETDDEDARARALQDANSIGSLATFIHGKDTELQLREAGNKTGSAEVYDRFIERCNSEISKLILGNTLTTEASAKGTQALGTVHKKVEEAVAKADREFVLNVLNYDMADIFAHMGINTAGGKFCFPEKKDTDQNTKMNILTQLRNTFLLPVDDDYLYEEFGVEKPRDYDKQKQLQLDKIMAEHFPNWQEEKRIAAYFSKLFNRDRKEELMSIYFEGLEKELEKKSVEEIDRERILQESLKETSKRTNLKDSIRSFFVKAPKDGAHLDW
ncbi:phage portal protein family protein [Prevotella fusca]